MITFGARERAERFYHPELDGLRFFAFFAVFLHHALPATPEKWATLPVVGRFAEWIGASMLAGGLGVDFFFCLSSYLITELLLREYETHGTLDLRAFFIRRVLRIWPLYYVFILLAFFVFPLFLPKETIGWRPLVAYLFVMANWECAFNGYPAKTIAPLWSVSIEEQFYLAWPLITRTLRPERLIRAVGALLVIALCTRGYLVMTGAKHPALWCNTFARLDPIAFGALLALRLDGRALVMPTWLRGALVAGSMATMIALVRFFPIDAKVPSVHLVWTYLVIGAACAVIVAALLRPMTERARVLGSRPLVYMGRLTYGLYVFHFTCIATAGLVAVTLQGTLLRMGTLLGLGLGLTVLCAVLSYHLIERPFLRLKTRFARVESRPE